MNDEQKNVREQLRNDVIKSIYKSADEYYNLLEKLGIDLNNKEQMDRYIEAIRISSYLEIHWFFKKIREGKKHLQKALDKIELAKAKHDIIKLMKSCDRFPKWIRIRIHRKQIKYLANRILEYTTITNDPTIYAGVWEIAEPFVKYPHLQRILLSTSMRTEGETKDGTEEK